MAVQQIGLDYGWLIDLVKAIGDARGAQPPAAKPTAVKQVSPTTVTPYAGPTSALGEKSTYQLEKEQRREDLLAAAGRKHEMALKQMDIDAKLAEAMSKERIAGVGAEAGIEQAEIGAAATVGAAQKTTMEKGYEFVEMLMGMDEESANELVANLLAKETQQAERPISTITTRGETMELPGAEPVGDPNNPLTWLREVGFDPEAGAPRPKPTGAAAKPEIDQYLELIDDMMDKNPQSIIAIATGKGWDELKGTMRAIGGEAGFGEDTINAGIAMYEALVPEYVEPEEGGGLVGAIKGALTPLGLGREELPPEAVPGAEMYLEGAGAFKEGAPTVEKIPGFAKTLEEFIETIITGPFHPAYEKWKRKKAGKAMKEPEVKEVGEITEQDVITEMGTWDETKLREFQRIAKDEGIYKGEVDGKLTQATKDAMKKYYKGHKEEWGE